MKLLEHKNRSTPNAPHWPTCGWLQVVCQTFPFELTILSNGDEVRKRKVVFGFVLQRIHPDDIKFIRDHRPTNWKGEIIE